MEKFFMALSYCLKRNENPNRCRFHFRGVYQGKEIEGIEILVSSFGPFREGESYMIYAKVLEVRGNILWGELISYKALDKTLDCI